MARNSYNLLELDVDKLFEDHKIEEIIEIEKLLDAEIERKRVELRSMVGWVLQQFFKRRATSEFLFDRDRYKDGLAASDAIKNMKTISQQIVDNIQTITDVCEGLITKNEDKEVEDEVKVDRWERETENEWKLIKVVS